MPLDPATAAAVSGAQSGMQDVKGFGLGLLQNRWNRKYNEKMYEKQRQDSMADWQRQADYNSPQAQMIRYKQAGLNPNLIYGSATNSPMAQMKSADLETSELPPYQLNKNSVGEAIGTYQNLLVTNQQVDNLKKTNENIQAQTDLAIARRATELLRPWYMENQNQLTQANTAFRKLETSQKGELFKGTLELQKQAIDNALKDLAVKDTTIGYNKAKTQYTKDENARRQEMQPLSVTGKQRQNENLRIKNIIDDFNIVMQGNQNRILQTQYDQELQKLQKAQNDNDANLVERVIKNLAMIVGMAKQK